ncbi:MAG: hypothetical protein RML36_15200 [Anaerolineae bacterium]|nr:hypothetical protein [Anaerolineae bacterium]MDW8100818.1 hypothetical protein [Anaerolineae bacterium]
MALPTHITVIEISAEQDRHALRSRSVEPDASTPQAKVRGNLYLFLNLSGTGVGQARLYRQVLNTVQAVYYEQMAGSVTSSLNQAILAAHGVIRRANAVTPQAVWRGSLTCLVVRESDLFLMHAGPGLSFIAHPDKVDQFPAEVAQNGTYLGNDELPEIQFFQTSLRGDTTLLLANADWLDHIPATTLAAIIAAPDLELGVGYLREVAQETGLAALVIAIQTAPDSTTRQAKPEEPVEEVKDDVEPRPALTETVPLQAEMPEPESLPHQSVAEGQHTVRSWRSFRLPSLWPRRPKPIQDVSKVTKAERPPRPSGERSYAPLKKGRQPTREKAPSSQPRRARSYLAFILALWIPLLTAGLVGVIYWQQGVARAQQFRALIDQAQVQATAAASRNDPATARDLLNQGNALLDEAERLRPGSPEVQQLRLRIQEHLDSIDQVQPLYLVFTLKEFGASDRDPGRVIVSGDNVFVLDRGLDQVDHYRLSELGDSVTEVGQEPLLRKGQVLGGQTVGELIDMAWVPAGNGRKASALLILDASGNLWQWLENLGLSAVPIAAAETWRYPQKVSTYFGRLYLMDTQANTILRYTPTDDGYSSPPEPYFAPEIAGNVDLKGAMDFSINGNIWILFANGRVLKFFQGKPQPFELTGFPGRLRAPAAIVAGLNEGSFTGRLYIGDAEDGRIIEFDKNGRFLRQMRPSDPKLLQDLRSLFMDEVEKAVYILTGKGLYKAQLPPEESP